jgi:quercetin dioxygenase-like cupin family protein
LLRWNEGYRIEEHVNSEVDVVMTVLQGRGRLTIDGVDSLVDEGTITVIPKGTRREILAEAAPFVYLNVHKRRRRLMPGSPKPSPITKQNPAD